MSAIDDTEDRPVNTTDDQDPLLAEFQRLKKDIVDAERARSKWRTEANECFDFVANHQWSDEDKRLLEEQHRPTVSFNRTAPLLAAVCGLEINNRQGVVYLPRTMGSVTGNELITNAAKWIRDECDAEDEESEAFRDLAVCGEGWVETRMDYDADPMGQVVEERVDPTEMGVNKYAFRANYRDARMIYRIRDMDPDDVRALVGLEDNLSDDAIDASTWLDRGGTPEDGGKGFKKDYPDETPERVRSAGGRKRRGQVKVVQCQYWKREPVNIVATQSDTEEQHMTDQEFEVFKNRAAQTMLTPEPILYEHARSVRKVYYECFIGIRILDQRPLDTQRFTFNCMTGYRDKRKKCFYGMVRDMLDPQRWANKFFSQTMNIMNTNAKGGLMAETDAFLNKAHAERDWADPTKIVWAKPGSLQKQKIKDRTPPPMPNVLESLMTLAISSIRDVTGVNLELLGQADREQAASLEAQRRQSAMTVLATMFNNLRRFRKAQGRTLLYFIEKLPDGTLIRVVGKDSKQAQFIPLVKQDIDFKKFDVIVDQAPTSPDQKQFVWGVTAQILQMQILPPPAIIELLKYSPYPESVVEEIRKAMGMDSEMPPEMLKQKLDQAEQALQMMEEKLKEALENVKSEDDKNALEMMKIEVDEYRAYTERLEAQWDARIKAATAIIQQQESPDGAGGDVDDSGGDAGNAAPSSAGAVSDFGGPDLPYEHEGQAGGGAPSQGGSLEAKVDQLTAMVASLVQAIQPPQEPPVPPEGVPPAGPEGV